jgi:hypothetical protein
LTDCGKNLSLPIVLLRCYELRVTGKISQSVNMTAKQGISRVMVVTGDNNCTFIDTVCQSNCFRATYSSRELYLPQPKSDADGTQSFITTASLPFPHSFDPRMALTEPFTMYIPNHRSYKVLAGFRTPCTLTQQMSFRTLWPNVQIMLDAWI